MTNRHFILEEQTNSISGDKRLQLSSHEAKGHPFSQQRIEYIVECITVNNHHVLMEYGQPIGVKHRHVEAMQEIYRQMLIRKDIVVNATESDTFEDRTNYSRI